MQNNFSSLYGCNMQVNKSTSHVCGILLTLSYTRTQFTRHVRGPGDPHFRAWSIKCEFQVVCCKICLYVALCVSQAVVVIVVRKLSCCIQHAPRSVKRGTEGNAFICCRCRKLFAHECAGFHWNHLSQVRVHVCDRRK